MNKKMKEIKGKMKGVIDIVKSLRTDGKLDEALEKAKELDTLQKEYEIENELFKAEIEEVPDEGILSTGKEKALNGLDVIKKMLFNKALNEKEKALVIGGDNGEDYLVPKDADTTIRELRGSYKSAKILTNIIKTNSMSGSFNFEDESTVKGKLTNFSDGEEISSTDNPKFVIKSFTIKLCGKIIPISNVLSSTSGGSGLLSYIDKWFVRCAVATENEDIFTALKKDKTVTKLAGWKQLKSSINKDIDPSCKTYGVIITNQTGFDILDSAVDDKGNPVLKRDEKDKTKEKFCEMTVEVFSNSELPNISEGTAPIFYGDIKSGCYFVELDKLFFSSSEHHLFGKNQTALRMVEGYDAIQADKNAYVYATLEESAAITANEAAPMSANEAAPMSANEVAPMSAKALKAQAQSPVSTPSNKQNPN